MKKWKKAMSGLLAAAMAAALLPGMSFESKAARLPDTTLETIEEGTYKVPVKLYTAGSEGTSAELSMGDEYIGSEATVVAKDNRFEVTIDVDIEAGMTYFGYFESEDAYNTYINGLQDVTAGKYPYGLPSEIQALRKDVNTAPDDVKLVTVEKTYTDSGTGKQITCNGIDEITFRIPACTPIYYAGFNAVGMDEGNITQYAKFGFEWNRAELIEGGNESGDDNTGDNNTGDDGNTGDNSNAGDNTGDNEPVSILIQRYNELKTMFEALDPNDYVTWDDAGDTKALGLGWTTLENLFEKYDSQVADGSVDLEALKSDLQTAYGQFYNSLYMVKKNNLAAGYTYSIPVSFVPVKEETISFSEDEDDLTSITVKVPDYDAAENDAQQYLNNVASLINAATLTVNNKNSTLVFTYDSEPIEGNKYLGSIAMEANGAQKITAKGTWATATAPKNLTMSTLAGMRYLYEMPLVTITPRINGVSDKTQAVSAFMILDYDHATITSQAEVDKSGLQDYYDKYSRGYTDWVRKDIGLSSYYYATSVMEPLLAEGGLLEQAGQVLEKEDATQQEVDDIYNALYEAFNKNTPKLLKEEFYEVWDNAGEYLKETDTYTEESLAVLQEAYDYCQGIEDYSFTKAVTVDGVEVYGYLPGENIHMTEEEKTQGLQINQDIGNGTRTEESLSEEELSLWTRALHCNDVQYEYNPSNSLSNFNSFGKNYYWYKAIQKVNTAIESLEAYGDTTELSSLVKEAEAITTNEEELVKYTIKSGKNLTDVVSTVNTALANGKLTEARITELTTQLQAAIEALVDRTALKTAIDHGNELIAQTDTYTKASIEMYNEKLTEAKVLYGDSYKNITKIEIEAQIAALQAAEELLAEKSDEGLDKDNLADGKYMVDVNLWHATQDKESMGNQALYHHGIITVKDGKYSLMIVGHEVTVGVVTGKLKGIEVKPGGTQEEEWVVPDSVDGAGEGNYAFEFELTSKGEKEYLPSRIQVEEGTPMGTDWVESRLRIGWDSLRKTGESAGPSEIISGEIIPDVSGPLYYVDAETGVIVQAEEGVFPDGVTIVVKKVDLDTEGAATSLIKYVSNYQLYEVTAYDAEGNEVQPSGIVSVTLPVPEGFDSSNLCVYHISDSGSLSLIQGTVDDNGYTIKTSKVGYLAVAEKNSTTLTKPGNTVPTKTTTATTKTAATTPKTTAATTTRTAATTKTGDMAQTALLLAAAAAALAVIAGVTVRRRRREG